MAAEPGVGQPKSSMQAAPEAVPWGQAGEVWVAGEGLAAGYLSAGSEAASRFRRFALRLPELTAPLGAQGASKSNRVVSSADAMDAEAAAAGGETGSAAAAPPSWVAGPGGEAGGEQAERRWFRTGDLGRLLPDGEQPLPDQLFETSACQPLTE
jgi:acyl-CoA synthetase (AMP-forming)/AMP-acid ligase II